MSLDQKTKIWHNNAVSRRFGKYSFHNQTDMTVIITKTSISIAGSWGYSGELWQNSTQRGRGQAQTQFHPFGTTNRRKWVKSLNSVFFIRNGNMKINFKGKIHQIWFMSNQCKMGLVLNFSYLIVFRA